jgi:hypothetical protein
MVPWSDAEGLASTAQEMGVRVLRGPIRYAAAERSLQVGDVEIDELLHEIATEEVLLIVAPVGPAPDERSVCPLCHRTYQEDECPHCRAEREEAKRALQERLLFDEGFPRLPCW